MTTPSTPRKAGPLLGTGAQTSWPFTFKVFAASDIAVTIANNLGVETALVLNADYSVTLNSNQDTSPGGTVTYPISGSALPSGSKLTIFGNLPYDQPLDLPSGGNFSPLALENQLDRLTMQIQQLREQVGRSLTVPVTSGVSPSLPSPIASNIIGWNASGDNLENYPLSELATSLAFATYRYDTFTGNGSTTQFTLSADPVTLGNLDVAVGGVTQTPGIDYLLVDGVLAFTSAPPNGVTILARFGEGIASGPSMDSYDVRFRQAGTGTVDRTAEAKMRETVSVSDFGAAPSQSAANNTTYIHAAFAYALATGAEIEFEPGTYNHAGLVYEGSNLSLVGKNTVLNYTGDSTIGTNDAVVIRSANNTNASGFKVRGIKFQNGWSSLKVIGQGTGIYSDILITECEFVDSYSGQLWMEHCSDAVIDSNYFVNGGDNGVYYSFSKNAVISNNVLRNCGGSGSITIGYIDTVVPEACNIVVSGNTIYADADAPVPSITWTYGIDAVFCNSCSIVGNTLYNQPGSVTGRLMKSGIGLEEHIIKDVLISGNTITNVPEEGIRVGVAADSQISNVSIVGNTITDCNHAVHVFRTTNIVIKGNVVQRCQKSGIYLEPTCEAATVDGNTLKDCNQQSIYASYYGVITYAKNTNIVNNTFVDSQTGGTISTTRPTPSYIVTDGGLAYNRIFLFSNYVLDGIIDPRNKTWAQIKSEIQAISGWTFTLISGCENYKPMSLRRTQAVDGIGGDHYAPGGTQGFITTNEMVQYVYVDTAATSTQVLNNTFKTGTLELPSHHSNGAMFTYLPDDTRRDVNTLGGGRQFNRSAIPTSGYYLRGDTVWNSAPSAGGAPGWVCTAAGNPGTWKAMANLAA
jgi:hypothetical protein